MVENKKRTEASIPEYNGAGFIILWTVVILAVVFLGFLVRMLGYEHNPLPFYSLIPSHAFGTAAVVSIVIGCFIFVKGYKENLTPIKRKGALFCFMGLVMLAGFFLFHGIMPLIFGEGAI